LYGGLQQQRAQYNYGAPKSRLPIALSRFDAVFTYSSIHATNNVASYVDEIISSVDMAPDPESVYFPLEKCLNGDYFIL